MYRTFPLPVETFWSRLKSGTLAYLSNRDRKITLVERGGVLRIPQIRTSQYGRDGNKEVQHRFTPNYPNKLVFQILNRARMSRQVMGYDKKTKKLIFHISIDVECKGFIRDFLMLLITWIVNPRAICGRDQCLVAWGHKGWW